MDAKKYPGLSRGILLMTEDSGRLYWVFTPDGRRLDITRANDRFVVTHPDAPSGPAARAPERGRPARLERTNSPCGPA
jgi:hypothetical protein